MTPTIRRIGFAEVLLLACLGAIGCTSSESIPVPGESWLPALSDGVFLPAGTWIDFPSRYVGLEEAAVFGTPAFLAEVEDGLAGYENWGAWGVGERTRIRFVLRSVEPLDLLLKCRSAKHPGGRRQSVEVIVNGRRIGALDAGRRWRRHRLEVPEDLLRAGDNNVELVYGFHLDGIPGQDDRPLALALEFAGLVPRGRDLPPSAGSARVMPDRDAIVFTGPGTFLVPIVVPADALALEVSPVGERGSWLRAGVLTLDGREIGGVGVADSRHRIDLEELRDRQVFLFFDVEPVPGKRLVLRHPRLLRAPPAPPGKPPLRAPAIRPDVVVVVLDAARPDHFSAYGYERDTTPRIDRLAAESLVFRNAVAECPYTLCSMPNLLAGLSFPRHGLTAWGQRLSSEVLTLTEILSGLGYRTVGLTANPHSSRATGADQGFDEFLETWRLTAGRGLIHPDFLTARAAEQIVATPRDQPLFLLAHYLPPHEPYDPDPRFDLFGDPAYAGPVTGKERFVQTAHARDIVRDAADLARLEALYDGNLRMVDAAVGDLVDALKQAGRWRDTLFVLTSDHGEAFDEHGFLGHAKSLYDEMLRVPLILRLPDAERPADVDLNRLASPGDVLPTVLGWLGQPEPAGVSGADLLTPPVPDRWLPLRSEHEQNPFFGLRTARFKLVARGVPASRRTTPEVRLYDLATDPGETVDHAAEQPLLRVGLGLLLERALSPASDPLAEPQERIRAEDEEMLRSLGYLG